MNIMADGKLLMTEQIQYKLVLSSLHVAPSGVIKGGDLVIETTSLTVEEGGVIDLNEGGDLAMGDGKFVFIVFNTFHLMPRLIFK